MDTHKHEFKDKKVSYYEKNREKIRLKYQENKDRHKEYRRLKYQENKEKIKEDARLKYQENNKKKREYMRLKYQANKEKKKMYSRLKYQKKKEKVNEIARSKYQENRKTNNRNNYEDMGLRNKKLKLKSWKDSVTEFQTDIEKGLELEENRSNRKCFIESCDSTTTCNYKFCRIPSNEVIRKKLEEALNHGLDPVKDYFVCAKHLKQYEMSEKSNIPSDNNDQNELEENLALDINCRTKTVVSEFSRNEINKIENFASTSSTIPMETEEIIIKNCPVEERKIETKIFGPTSLSIEEQCGFEQVCVKTEEITTEEETIHNHPYVETINSNIMSIPSDTDKMAIIVEKLHSKYKNKRMKKINASNNWKNKYYSLLSKYYRIRKLSKNETKNLTKCIDATKCSDHVKNLAKMILSDKEKTENWSEDQKALAGSLYYKSPKAYEFLKNIGCTLPSRSTFSKYLPIKNSSAGLYDEQFKILEKRFKQSDLLNSLGVLVFDKLHIRKCLTYDAVKDSVCGVVDDGTKRQSLLGTHIWTFMIRGLISEWSYVVGHVVCSNSITCNKLQYFITEILDKCNSHHIKIVAVTCDQGPSNKSVYKRLGVTAEKPYFYHKKHKIIAFYDYVNLLKTLRNTLQNCNFEIKKNIITWGVVETLFKIDNKQDVRLCPKLKSEHIYPNSSQKKIAKYAIQAFSLTAAKAIRTLEQSENFGTFSKFCEPTANFFEQMNNLFDIFNVKFIKAKNQTAFKRPLSKDSQFISKYLIMTKTILKDVKIQMYRNESSCKQNFGISGIVQNINGLQELIKYLQEIPQFSYFLTSKLQKAPLKHLFGVIKSRVAHDKYPSAYEFQNNIKYLSSSQQSKLQMTPSKSRIATSSHHQYTTAQNILSKKSEISNLLEFFNEIDALDITEDDNNIVKLFMNLNISEDNALKYFCWYIAHKMSAQCIKCKEELIEKSSTLDLPTDSFNKFRNLSCNEQLLKNPNKDFINICSYQFKCFKNKFKCNVQRKNLKSYLKNEIVELTKTRYSGWYSFNDSCYQHKMFILDFFLVLLIRRNCKWFSRNHFNVSTNKINVIKKLKNKLKKKIVN